MIVSVVKCVDTVVYAFYLPFLQLLQSFVTFILPVKKKKRTFRKFSYNVQAFKKALKGMFFFLFVLVSNRRNYIYR